MEKTYTVDVVDYISGKSIHVATFLQTLGNIFNAVCFCSISTPSKKRGTIDQNGIFKGLKILDGLSIQSNDNLYATEGSNNLSERKLNYRNHYNSCPD